MEIDLLDDPTSGKQPSNYRRVAWWCAIISAITFLVAFTWTVYQLNLTTDAASFGAELSAP
ncbi:MAG: hypothetical protein AAGA62_13180, partial [Bacteroidota bacterium]